jgi:hypothetical protein
VNEKYIIDKLIETDNPVFMKYYEQYSQDEITFSQMVIKIITELNEAYMELMGAEISLVIGNN